MSEAAEADGAAKANAAAPILLGCIADDFTGASDLANTLARAGMRTVQVNGLPAGPLALGGAEAAVVALKIRSAPAAEAVAAALAALAWLRAAGAEQILFKYCSTFDSTPEGVIGPVAEALAAALGDAGPAVVCPAFPAAGRTVYQGHLFVGDRLLSESGMEAHPLTPMTDPDLRRWLARQCRGGVGHAPLAAVRAGPAALGAALAAEAAAGRPLVVTDALTDDDLRTIGRAAAGAALVTGGSGVALGLPEAFRGAGRLSGAAPAWRGAAGPGAVLSGSCSAATRAQAAAYAARAPALVVEADAVMDGRLDGAAVADWLLARIEAAPMACSSADPPAVAAAQARHGRAPLAAALEGVFAEAARRLAAAGVRRLVVAGGETAGAIVSALAPPLFEIGPEIAPGVPALRAGPMTLALKSGNFGGERFFADALDVLKGDDA